jgi:hypothetical protein
VFFLGFFFCWPYFNQHRRKSLWLETRNIDEPKLYLNDPLQRDVNYKSKMATRTGKSFNFEPSGKNVS